MKTLVGSPEPERDPFYRLRAGEHVTFTSATTGLRTGTVVTVSSATKTAIIDWDPKR